MRDEKRTQVFDRSSLTRNPGPEGTQNPGLRANQNPPRSSHRGQYRTRDLTPARTGIGYETR